MKKIISYNFLCLVCLISFVQCKKKEKGKVTTTVTVYLNCNSVASNQTFYIGNPPSSMPQLDNAPTEVTTDANGQFTFETDKTACLGSGCKSGYVISSDKYMSHGFASFEFTTDENSNVGIIKETASNQLILKLKTNHVLTNLDTINYAFQYDLVRYKVYGTITKDTIIGIYNKSINPVSYNASPTTGELKTIWWGFGQPTPTNQVQVDYTIHGCAGVADTAYIIVP